MTQREPTRCTWAPAGKPVYLAYHDEQWGVPVHDDRALFEMLILEGAQAGLSWETILNKRAAYRRAFDRFDPRKVARYDARKVRALALDPGTRTGDTLTLLGGQFGSPLLRDAAWQWLRDNFDAVTHRLPGDLQSVTFQFPDGFCDAAHRKELETFFTPKMRELQTGELELAQTLERIDLCVAQKQGHAADIHAALGE